MTRTFGIEIEAFGNQNATVVRALNDAGIPCIDVGYSHRDHGNAWKIMSDGSVRNNRGTSANCFELVSPILSGSEGIEQVRKVMTILTRLGAKVNKSCGLHVHIGARDFTLTEWKKIAKNYMIFENFFDAIMPLSRRANNCFYVKSNRAAAGSDGYRSDYTNVATAKACAKVDAADSIDGVISVINPGASQYNPRGSARYHKLNGCSFWQHGTIEFRQHSGTVDADKACNWILLLLAFVERAKSTRLRPYTTEVALGVSFRQFCTTFQLPDDMRAYFKARYQALHTDAN